jgi:hypothetical protein
MGDARVSLNGSGPQTAYVNTYRTGQSQGGNYSSYRSYGVYEGQGWGSWTNSTQYWSANLGGLGISGTFTIPSNNSTGNITLYDHYWNRGHDGNGHGSDFNSTFCIDTNHSTIGDGCATAYEGYPPRIPKPPAQPATPTFRSVTATTIDYNFFNSPDNGGSGETTFRHQVATDAGFANIVKSYDDGSSPGQASGLTPGTGHWIRYASVNAYGQSPWSGALAQTTLPAVPPGLSVAASPSGTSATLTFTPPGGVTGVSPYRYEGYVGGVLTYSGDSPSTVVTVDGLTPGVGIAWRASAFIGAYQSPWSDYVTVIQPKPNTSPGDYFDGNTPDTPDTDYVWTGAVNGSTSQAVGKAVTGWQATFSNGAVGAIHQVTGGLVGSNAARVLVQIDSTAAGSAEGGQSAAAGSRSEVAPSTTYVGSIYVNPSRSQRMRALLQWLNAAGAVVGSTFGTDQVVSPGSWTRLVASGAAPGDAAFVVVRVHDVAGTGHSNWRGGDSFLMDAAMISLGEEFAYFDGDTPDTDQFVYAWTETAHASPSTATPVGIASVGTLSGLPGTTSLIDPDCEPVPTPPRPPTVPSDCIEDVGLWRRYYVSIPAVNISDWLSVVPTLEVVTGSVAARQIRIRFYPNPFDYAPDQVDTNDWCAEQIISYMPASTVLTLDGVTMRAWAEVNDGPAQSADHLLYGTGGQPATWPILSCGISYLVSLEAPIDAPAGNLTTNAYVTVRS